jgi:hypothetical protein
MQWGSIRRRYCDMSKWQRRKTDAPLYFPDCCWAASSDSKACLRSET